MTTVTDMSTAAAVASVIELNMVRLLSLAVLVKASAPDVSPDTMEEMKKVLPEFWESHTDISITIDDLQSVAFGDRTAFQLRRSLDEISFWCNYSDPMEPINLRRGDSLLSACNAFIRAVIEAGGGAFWDHGLVEGYLRDLKGNSDG